MEAAAVWYRDQYDQYDIRPFKLLEGLCPCRTSWLPHQLYCKKPYSVIPSGFAKGLCCKPFILSEDTNPTQYRPNPKPLSVAEK